MCSCTVPGPVSGLSATPGVTQLTISWTAPSEPNGVITMYQVTYNSTGVLNYTNTSATQLTLRDLPPNTAVEYSVRAYTIIGPGDAVSNITQLQIFVSYLLTAARMRMQRFSIHVISRRLIYLFIAQISIVSAVALNSTAVRVTWTPLNVSAVDHYYCALQ